jgi:NTE family protein
VAASRTVRERSGMRALVLGGGGVTGIAWELGVIAGLAEAGVRLGDADLVVGTSAGSVVAAQVLSGTPVEELYARQLRPPTGEIAASLGLGGVARWVLASFSSRDEAIVRGRIGRMALRARTAATADERRAVIAGRLPSHDWPARSRLVVTAVEASTGEFRAFDAGSGVDLVDAVAASCAVPLVWPPIPIDGRAYVDGGVRSPVNADLAAGADQVVVLAPIARAARSSGRVDRQLATLGPGVRTVTVTLDPAARRAIGRNTLDPVRRAPAARAGRAQAPRVADAVRAVWS